MEKIRDRVGSLELTHSRELGRRLFVKWESGKIFESGIPGREWSGAELVELERAGYDVILFGVIVDECTPGQAADRDRES